MSWLFICTRTLARLLFFVVALGAADAGAQKLETALMPGPVIKGHAKIEGECKTCHVPFDHAGQARRCLDCHKPVAADMAARAGFHGRLRDRECQRCHTDHKGRDALIVRLDERSFDHVQTDFALLGRHRDLACSKCHRAGTRHRDTPQDCLACHRKDDQHKGGLGARCANCHDASGWKNAKFDHQKTRFALANRHVEVRCAECHVGERYANTARECIACHRKDDAHKGVFAARCEACHVDTGWKSPTFRHERDTPFALRERHKVVKCVGCHKTSPTRFKTPTACVACHEGKDPHKGSLGRQCESCHTEARWKAERFDHDLDTAYVLRERHRLAKCDGCHTDAAFRQKPLQACKSCHTKDDRQRGHKGANGERCETCHTEKSWRDSTFDHDKATAFVLRDGHRSVKCVTCHVAPLYERKLATDCIACHEKDDHHKTELGRACANCHTEKGWKVTTFEHAKTAFPLKGRHGDLACAKCHTQPTFKDARPECLSCHERDDVHGGKFDARCDRCHSNASWKLPDFDHNRQSDFPLDGAHVKVKCQQCHPAPPRGPAGGAPPKPPRPGLGAAAGKVCYACHKKDDVHTESLGLDCVSCHGPTRWRDVKRRPPEMAGMAGPKSRSVTLLNRR